MSPSTFSYICNYVYNKNNIHIISVLNVCMCIVYLNYILIFIFSCLKHFLDVKFFSLLKIREARRSHPQRMCWIEDINVRISLSSTGWTKEDQGCIIYWELLVAVGNCWELLGDVEDVGAVGSKYKKQDVGWCTCRKQPRKSKGDVKI